MNQLDSALEAINDSLEATSRSLTQLKEFYSTDYSKDPIAKTLGVRDGDKLEKVSLLTLKNGSMLSYVNSLLLVLQGKVDVECKDPSMQLGREMAIRDRVVLERGVKPLEKKLSYQLDNLVKAYRRTEKEYLEAERRAKDKSLSARTQRGSDSEGSSDSSDSEEEASYRPNVVRSKAKPSAVVSTSADQEQNKGADAEENADGIYRPPKISAMLPPSLTSRHFEDKFSAKEHQDRSGKSRMQAMEEYLKDQSDQPDWEASIGTNIVNHGRGGIKSSRATEKELAVTNYEEENFTRVNPNMGKSKVEKRKMKQRERMAKVNVLGGEDFGIFNNSKRKLEDSTSRRGNKKSKNAWDRAKRRL
ncbi:small subunit rRNA maturation protein LCP5 KNAG_0D02160 [Huiozyma naganishii CBS 8797]|uniref:Uncharacterized protein n=1 Tax=Huiozyma naganishii (strain ATCC MYA-139 / BCRC 22969 / CBS 8797 / KCTC 17520 / NBRC 10181 / NCYC 3082 / Yp74L-3) TaxID=1071383 RepID=J7S6W7_HUIN7|nr:hypothetical protein KNAG_0D02160 [Kazachstania naganishii CBS 8797]CCK69966.1 hypothetical protein KNAG_0D02160 [Kazachstania naganishii CBS 8797]